MFCTYEFRFLQKVLKIEALDLQARVEQGS